MQTVYTAGCRLSPMQAANKRDCSQSDFFFQGNDTVLNSEEQNICEGALTEKECLEALMSMDSNKTPGMDGLSAEFYKVFWKDVSHFLIPALNYSFESGSLSITQTWCYETYS